MNKEEILEVKKECDNYKHTVWALLAFANHSRWDFKRKKIYSNSKYSFGRRMTKEKGEIVTPDLVVQRFVHYGIVSEAKRTLPRPQHLWNKALEQLADYDMIKEGWFTSTEVIDDYDVTFLTDLSRSVDFGDFFEKSDRKWSHKVAIIGFEPTPLTTDTYITLMKVRGNLSDHELDDSLRRSIKIAFTDIFNDIGKIKFYDDPPHVVYTARIFWEDICSPQISLGTWDKDRKAHVLELTVEEITEELQKYYGQPSRGKREPEIPNKKWVKNMLEFLVTAGHAERSGKDGVYTIFWKRIREDLLDKFSRDWIRLKQKKRKKEIEQQLKLFRINQDHEKLNN
jgi:hypothetical protein